MKFGVQDLIVWAAVIVNSFGIDAIHFRSVGKNYNINYNSNTNTNLDWSRLYQTIVEQLYGSEIKAPLSALCSAGGQCSQFYEHFTASFSSDQGEFEEDYFYDDIANEDTLSPEEASGDLPFTTPEGDHVVKLMPISDDENKLEVVELDAVEAPAALSAVPPVNQSGQIISLDSIRVANSSEQESDPLLKTFNQTLSDDS
ncbi:hypothetical protein DAPPUDRAFT_326073 [Daphnia pulex]|uniref:Uncharacterized protein n=1 Tax=Daphnia pulex TaxID=6669 RepID=E9H6M9_DAPPU|nr:hypothetical protein DAPPUDRAFT_326073 [Daphnia pulex]|eukprot:EFX72538.1 hypothetical protein DAPPUDRAFT_326073 [Daphnia pulex]